MAEVIVSPDVEALVVAFLKSEYAARDILAQVGTKVRSGWTAYTRVSRIGGGMRDIAYDSPRMLFECYADDTVTASDLARVTRALILAWSRIADTVTRVQDGGDTSFLPDPDTNKPRYQFVAQLDVKGSAI